jgi:hypothetical protein
MFEFTEGSALWATVRTWRNEFGRYEALMHAVLRVGSRGVLDVMDVRPHRI